MALAPKPDLLAKRLAAARQRVTATAKSDLAQATKPAPAPAPAPPPRAPKAKRQAHNPATEPTQDQPKAASRAKGKGMATGDRAEAVSEPDLATKLRQMAENPAALAFVTDAQLVEIFSAMVSNAANKGSTGAMDRQALFRAAGLPFQGGFGAKGRGGASKLSGPEIAGRLETALNRARSRAPVADDEPEAESGLETAA